jgi:RNA polymerase sigma-70 factor (ECF subfamily)
MADRYRRAGVRRYEVHEDPAENITDGAEDIADKHWARRTLTRILEGFSPELREVFVLYEIERLTLAEVSEVTRTPQGTVASRLRRAREAFESEVARIRATMKRKEHGL